MLGARARVCGVCVLFLKLFDRSAGALILTGCAIDLFPSPDVVEMKGPRTPDGDQ